jgi:glycosyltransferase involved in cell wall biosynthesis/Tfp pilus assembly protein PilF
MILPLSLTFQPRVRSLIRSADAARDRKDWPEAIRLYEKVLAADPSLHGITVQLGHAYKETGNLGKAGEAYQAALQGRPDDDDLLLQIGHLYKLRGNIPAAAQAYRKALNLNPANGDAANEYLHAVDAVDPAAINDVGDEARLAMLRALATLSEPTNPAGQVLATASRAQADRRWAEAARHYQIYLSLMPEDAAIWVQYGHALKEQSLFDAAGVAYRRSIALKGGVADTHLQLGHLLKLQERLEDAVDAYLIAHQLDPESCLPVVEFETLWGEVPGLIYREFPIDWQFVEAVYGAGNKTAPRYRSCDHLLFMHWLSPDLPDAFDFMYYYYANAGVAASFERPDRFLCLVHFCEFGLAELLPFNEDVAFDPDFYNGAYRGDYPLPPKVAYRHWLNLGRRIGLLPNRQCWLRNVLGLDDNATRGVDLDAIVTGMSQDGVTANWTDTVRYFIEKHVLQTTSYLPITAEAADFFVAIGDRFAVSGKEADALQVYERVLAGVPHHGKATIHRLDCLARMGSVSDLLAAHRARLERGATDIWSYRHIGTSQTRLGDMRGALLTLHAGCQVHPGDLQLRQQFEKAADDLLQTAWDSAVAIARTGSITAAQALLADAAALVSSLAEPESQCPRRPIRKIAIVHFDINPQCRLYRVDQKAEHIRAAGYEVTVFGTDRLQDYLEQIYKFDAVIFYRTPARAAQIFAVARSRSLGITAFYDVDDLIFTNDFPDSLESYGGSIGTDEYIGLQLGVPLNRHAITLCDYAIASTTPLATEMAKLTIMGKAFVHRNAFGSQHENAFVRSWKPRDRDQVVLFYGSGTKAHGSDFRDLVEPALIEMVRRHGDRVKIVLAGHVLISEALEAVRGNLEIHALNWQLDEYWAELSQADINIAVLQSSRMTDCKSEIKWMEAAMLGIPSVVSDTANYREVVTPGVTGMICRTAEDWIDNLDQLIRDKALRYRIGQAAWKRVTQKHSFATAAANIRDIFTQCSAVGHQAAKPTVVIVNVFYPPQAIGGATRVVHDNVRHLSEFHGDRFNLEVFTTGYGGWDDYKLSTYAQDGVRVVSLHRAPDPRAEVAIEDERTAAIFGAYLDEVRPALIHFHCIQKLTASIVTAAAERRIPYLVTAHDAWWISSHQFAVDDKGHAMLYNFSDPLSVVAIAGSEAYRRMQSLRAPLFGAAKVLGVSEKFAELYRTCGVPNVEAIANGVSDLVTPERAPAKDGRVRIGFLGGMHRIKGYHLIRYAFLSTVFSNLRLTMIDNSLAPGDTRFDTWNGTPVEFTAKVPEAHVNRLYARIDVLLAPSIWPESYGLVTREARHFGCWVVASDQGSIGDEIKENVNGHVIDVSNAKALITVLRRIDKDPHTYLRSPPNSPPARKAVEQTDDLAKLYGEVIAAAPPPVLLDDQPHTKTPGVWRRESAAIL